MCVFIHESCASLVMAYTRAINTESLPPEVSRRIFDWFQPAMHLRFKLTIKSQDEILAISFVSGPLSRPRRGDGHTLFDSYPVATATLRLFPLLFATGRIIKAVAPILAQQPGPFKRRKG